MHTGLDDSWSGPDGLDHESTPPADSSPAASPPVPHIPAQVPDPGHAAARAELAEDILGLETLRYKNRAMSRGRDARASPKTTEPRRPTCD